MTDTESAAVEKFRKYDRTVLPVIDRRGVLLGVVTVDDVLDVAEESATREIQKFGGIEALDEPYIATPVLRAGPQAGHLADRAVPGRNAHRLGDGGL